MVHEGLTWLLPILLLCCSMCCDSFSMHISPFFSFPPFFPPFSFLFFPHGVVVVRVIYGNECDFVRFVSVHTSWFSCL